MANDWCARNSYLSKDKVEVCNFCGCTFRVKVMKQDGHNEWEEYYCPECHQEFRAFASLSPVVTKVSSRTDGKTVKYENL